MPEREWQWRLGVPLPGGNEAIISLTVWPTADHIMRVQQFLALALEQLDEPIPAEEGEGGDA
jgi:hypothetical protein